MMQKKKKNKTQKNTKKPTEIKKKSLYEITVIFLKKKKKKKILTRVISPAQNQIGIKRPTLIENLFKHVNHLASERKICDQLYF